MKTDNDDRLRLLQSQIHAFEQLLEVYERAVLDQSAKLESAHANLATRVVDLADYAERLEAVNSKLTVEMDSRRKAEENLRRSDRLASIGTLAAGIAHEINNPLGLISLEIHRARTMSHDPAVVDEALETISDQVRRCAQIVKSVLRYAREETSEKWPGSVNDVARKARDLGRPRADAKGITIHLDLADELPDVVMNPTELEQVFVNLIANSVAACESGCRIDLRTSVEGNAVRVVVVDDGCGLTEAAQNQAFEPFFTTHADEGGTGLGLNTCKTIVAGLAGSISISPGQGRGTSVVIDLPFGGIVPHEPER